MQRNVIFILIPLMLCMYAAVYGQHTQAAATLHARQIEIGDRAAVQLEVRHDSRYGRLEWAQIPDTFNSLEVVVRGKTDTLPQPDGHTVHYLQTLQVTGFDSGYFYIPSFAFYVIAGSDSPLAVRTDSLLLLVQTLAVDTTQGYKGIKEIIYVEVSWRDYIGWIAGGGLLAAAIILLIIYLVKRKKKPVEEPVRKAPPESIYIRYGKLLEEVDRKQLWQQNRIKEYYVELTDVLRSYIEERFLTPAMELTTDEILDKARSHAEMRQHLLLLEQILRTADLAKFAKAQPLPQEHAMAMDAARKFIAATNPASAQTT